MKKSALSILLPIFMSASASYCMDTSFNDFMKSLTEASNSTAKGTAASSAKTADTINQLDNNALHNEEKIVQQQKQPVANPLIPATGFWTRIRRALWPQLPGSHVQEINNQWKVCPSIIPTIKARSWRLSVLTALATGFGAHQVLKNMRFINAKTLAIPFALTGYCIAKPLIYRALYALSN
jgi:hypothetical protein